MRQTAGSRLIALVWSALVLSACSSTVTPSDLEQTGERTYTLYTSCSDERADDLSVRVKESANVVRLDDVRGTRYDGGDCVGGIEIELEAPIGDRQLQVEGERWIRIDDNCENANYAPADVVEKRAWRVPIPCEFLDD